MIILLLYIFIMVTVFSRGLVEPYFDIKAGSLSKSDKAWRMFVICIISGILFCVVFWIADELYSRGYSWSIAVAMFLSLAAGYLIALLTRVLSNTNDSETQDNSGNNSVGNNPSMQPNLGTGTGQYSGNMQPQPVSAQSGNNTYGNLQPGAEQNSNNAGTQSFQNMSIPPYNTAGSQNTTNNSSNNDNNYNSGYNSGYNNSGTQPQSSGNSYSSNSNSYSSNNYSGGYSSLGGSQYQGSSWYDYNYGSKPKNKNKKSTGNNDSENSNNNNKK